MTQSQLQSRSQSLSNPNTNPKVTRYKQMGIYTATRYTPMGPLVSKQVASLQLCQKRCWPSWRHCPTSKQEAQGLDANG